jgi:hypothetical protein
MVRIAVLGQFEILNLNDLVWKIKKEKKKVVNK